MNDLDPKQRFLTSGHAAKHQEWARSESGKAACESVLAEMAMTETDLNKIAGARSFVKLLLDITEVQPAKQKIASATLNYGPSTKPSTPTK